MKYYIARNGNPAGPFSIEQLRQERIHPDTLLWNETLQNWTRACEIPEVQTYVLSGAQPANSMNNGEYRSFDNSGYQHNQQPPRPQYQQQAYQQQYAQGYNSFDSMPPCPKTWLVESILVTLFCCLPFGIIGIIKASSVNSLYASGDYNGAQKASNDAGKWTKLGFFISLACTLLYFLGIFLLGFGVFGASAMGY